VLHAAYLHKRTPSSTSGRVTPYERLYGRVPSLGSLRIFGCLAYAKIPDEKRKKLLEKSIRTALLECLPGMQYKVLDLDNGDIQNVRHVKFDEHQFPAFGSRTGKFISEEEADNDLESDQDSTPDYAPSASSSDDDSDSEDETNDSDDDYHPQLAISHRSMAARKRPAQGFSHTPTPSHAPEDDDDPDDVQLHPQTTEVSNDSGGSYAAPVTSRPQRARKPVDRVLSRWPRMGGKPRCVSSSCSLFLREAGRYSARLLRLCTITVFIH
jgi:hypothetical protein